MRGQATVLLWLAGVSVGCAGSPRYPDAVTVYVDPAFSDGGVGEVQEYLDWASATGAIITPVIENRACSDADFGCASIHPETLDWIHANCNQQDAGCTIWHRDLRGQWMYTGWANVYVQDSAEGGTAQTRLHEMGHSLGLVHTGAGTLMCKDSLCAAETITAADVEQYKEEQR
jgi:hypothetical protein